MSNHSNFDVYYDDEVEVPSVAPTEENKIKTSSSAVDNLLVGKELVLRCAKANAKTPQGDWDWECLSLLGVATGAAFLFALLFFCFVLYCVRACKYEYCTR